MARLIEADAAKAALTGWETDPTDEEIEYAIDGIPTVDAVEVVRCQECRYFDTKADGTVGFCKCGEVCGYCHSMRVADDFCSYGERRDDHAAD